MESETTTNDREEAQARYRKYAEMAKELVKNQKDVPKTHKRHGKGDKR